MLCGKRGLSTIINLSDFEIDITSIKYGLYHSSIDNNNFIKCDLGVELESVALSVDTFVSQECEEEFHQFLRNTSYKLSNNVYRTKDTMCHKTYQRK